MAQTEPMSQDSRWVVDALLFDLDGTLIDSTPSVERSWRKLAARIGIDYDEIDGTYHGVPARQTLVRLLPAATARQIEEIVDWLVEVEVADTEDIVVLPGSLAVLDALPSHRWAIVTSGSRRLATARIQAAGLPMPRHLVTADDVTIGKPNPMPYLVGADRLGFAAGRCLVLEDAPAGITSGLAAGAVVLGLRTTHPELAVPTIKDLSELEVSADRLGVIVNTYALQV